MKDSTLKSIWFENNESGAVVLRLDWQNDRHHRFELVGDSPEDVSKFFTDCASYINFEQCICKNRRL